MNIISFLQTQSRYRSIITQNPKAIVLFSEGNTYKNSNLPLINELIKKTEIIYLTVDPQDDLLRNPIANVHVFLVDFGILGSLFLKTLSAKLFITTTPGLGVLALKKSKAVKHYSVYMHAPTDIHRYAKFSFDCFDSVVCSGDFQIKSLDYLEKHRDFPIKEKIALGVPYYDIMVQEYNNYPAQNHSSHKTILIAPSWGNSNFLNYYDKDLVGELLAQDYYVIFRPHPQSYKHEPALIKSITDKYEQHANFNLDKNNISNIDSIKKADVLISSYSGMVFDFIFLTEKPCILFDIAHIGKNFEDQDIDFPSWENQLMPKIGKLVSLTDTIDITQILEEIQINQEEIIKAIRKAKSEIANFGNASISIANYYLSKIEG